MKSKANFLVWASIANFICSVITNIGTLAYDFDGFAIGFLAGVVALVNIRGFLLGKAMYVGALELEPDKVGLRWFFFLSALPIYVCSIWYLFLL